MTAVDTTSEEFRHACEVRDIARRPLYQRQQYLVAVEQRRAKAAADRIKRDLVKLWDEKRGMA